ncbi:hypothetical protein BBO99_00008808 [Phytophthora kernoviae]|uniref:THH1/TOM1/TOM3 domain-containing protein n=2 Tax=Phytophthora kernoviae TaxID=325452 RepID=A0A3F2RD76_9STRA|nr:hypothetical protein G195_010970 [Phytophthora kernoviae 00238/432]KAG2509771.1 hypothetical protein JM16_008663 [Phytophthora kernoviae]KAG2512462.1 hypothetical protein JM18_008546 [Phytophthora kernoviae]RLN06511.1 hypothetical protein BBI17_004593 [Phytophthora kernoviae]RLN44984.1 hypothetical protein BBJ29_007399 [Phytophthora kernoviae]
MELLNKICLFGARHCFYTQSAAAGAAYCYAAVLAYTLSVSIQRSRLGEHGHATHLLPVKRMRWFPTFLSFAYFSRIAWLVLSNMHMFQWVEGSAPDYKYEHMVFVTPLLPTDIDIYVLGVTSFGKLATLLYFSAFTLLLRFWEDVRVQARRAEQPLARVAANQSVIAEYTRGAGAQRVGRSRKLFLVANVWIYLVECALLVLKTLFPGEKMVLFQMEYGFVALCFFLLAVMLARSIEVFDPHVSNPWLFYAIPELVPGALVIYMMNVKRQHQAAPPSWGITKARADEQTPLLQELRRLSNDLPHFRGQELHI